MTRQAAVSKPLFALALSIVCAAGAGAAADAASAGAQAARAGCPGQGRASVPPAVQEGAMLCLVNRARRDRGLEPLRVLNSLARAAAHKSADILRCDEFSHEACGRPFTYWMDRFGYRGCAEAENIAWGSGGYATPRTVFGLWMRSQGHRENILGSYLHTGLGLRVGTLEGHGGAHVWTEEFGSGRC